uniref:U10-Theriditoxin-Lha1a_1 n=1 Tax=Latrodectus hasselti TaxID=256736 RepID=A0A482ZIS1_LATHA
MNFVYIFLAAVVVFFRLISAKEIGLDSEKDETPNSPFFLEEEARENNQCIKKHYECTHDKRNCCVGKVFHYTCKCYDYTTNAGVVEPRCKCTKSLLGAITDFGINLWNRVTG